MWSWLSFIYNMFTSTCMEPTCSNKARNYPHGIPCCDEHNHEVDCSCWVGGDCDCDEEVIQEFADVMRMSKEDRINWALKQKGITKEEWDSKYGGAE